MDVFNGNFSELASLMQLSWAQNSQEPLLYTEPFLSSVLRQPGASVDLCPAIYDGDDLIAFGAGIPRRVQFDGASWNVSLTCFLTVSPHARKGGGLGVSIWRRLAHLAEANGLDAMISYGIEGDRLDRGLLNVAKFYDLPTCRSFRVAYVARPIPKNRPGFAEKADPAVLLRLAARLPEDIGFRRIWTAAEAHWQCGEREGGFGATLKAGAAEGVITAYTMSTASATPVCCGLVDDVLWDDLDAVHRRRLIDQLLSSASAAGVDVLLVPVMNYFDAAPFRAAGFRTTKRTLNLYLTSWNPRFPLKELSAAYIDVF
jgi:hypothetical protein